MTKGLVRGPMLAVVLLCSGCAGGAVFELPEVAGTDIAEARTALAASSVNPSRGWMSSDAVLRNADEVFWRIAPAARRVCRQVTEPGESHRCAFTTTDRPVQVDMEASDVNAYATADHQVVMNRGLIQFTAGNDEVAAVMAHEYAHVMLGHVERNQRNAAGGAALGALITGVLGVLACQYGCGQQALDDLQDLTQRSVEFGANAAIAAYSPEMEIEADHLAAYVLREAGYPLEAYERMFTRLHRSGGGYEGTEANASAAFFRTHPADDRRLASWRMTVREIREGKDWPVRRAGAPEEAE